MKQRCNVFIFSDERSESFISSFLLFVSILSSFLFCFNSLEFSFDFFFSNLRHRTPLVCHLFFVSATAAPTFYDLWVQYERSPANTLNSCTDPMWFIRTAAASRMGTRCNRSMRCKRMLCKAIPPKSNFHSWNWHLSGLNSLTLGAYTSFLNDTFSDVEICAQPCGNFRELAGHTDL